MRYLEVRRHTMRVKPGHHLSQAGVDLAREVGDGMGPFASVVTSSLQRARETAIAMGFAVDRWDERFNTMDDIVDAEVQWDAGFEAWSEALRADGPAARFICEQAAMWNEIVRAVPDGGWALLVGHGGFIEAGAVGCLPDLNYRSWGASCGYCEGVRLAYAGEHFLDAELLRVDQ
jgi:broad specificity phosphatase PhoE